MTTDEVRTLISLLLSSGSMSQVRSPSGGHVRLTLTAGMQDAAHLQEKVNTVRQVIPGNGRLQAYSSGPRGLAGVRFRATAPELRLAYNLLYPARVRRITSAVLELCGARALAWYWSDWLKPQQNGTYLLGHVGRTANEAAMVGQWMATILGVESELTTNPRPPHFPALRISADQVRKGAELLLDYAPASRVGLFESLLCHDDCLHEPGAALLPGEWQPEPQGHGQSPLAGDHPP